MTEYPTKPTARRRLRRIAIPALLLVAALPAAAHEPSRPSAAAVDLDAACPGDRWIGVLATGGKWACPPGWKPLFTTVDPRTGIDLPVPPGLRRFCLFRGEDPRSHFLKRAEHRPVKRGPAGRGEGGAVFEDDGTVDHHPFARIDPDCRVVGPAAASFFPPEALAEQLRRRFRREAGGPAIGLSSDKVRLVIVDSVQDTTAPGRESCPSTVGTGGLECSPHGWALAELARDLLGPRADLRARRALRWTYRIRSAEQPPRERRLGTVDRPGEPKRGGLYGYWSELADAVWRALGGWLAEGAGRPRLVLNLSLGWEGIYGTDVPVMRAAIATAVCRGALPVAAAGNRVAGPAALEKPLLPAAWERRPAPTARDCRELLGEPTPRGNLEARTPYRPLLYAAGGVEQDGRILSNARPHATPRRVAFGDHAAVYSGSPPGLVTLTGTSVSTLVVSAAAAVRWHADPELSAFDVMAELWRTGLEVDHPIDFCLDPSANCPPDRKARRIFLTPRTAPGNPTPVFTPPVDTGNPAYRELVEVARFSTLGVVAECAPQLLAHRGTLPAEPCPQRSRIDVAAQPWTGPQPGANHNPDCRYTEGSPGTLVLEFDPCFRLEGKPATLDDLTLVAGDRAFRLPRKAFLLGDPARRCPSDPKGDDPRRVQLVLTDFPIDDPHPIYLAVTVNGEHGIITPILHVPSSER